MRKTVIAVIFLAIASLALGQRVAPNDSGGAERALRAWITDEFRGRTRGEIRTQAKDPLRDVGWHFVFLVNTTNMSVKSAYSQMVRSTIRRFLDRQASWSRRGAVDLFSVYFYQIRRSSEDNSIIAMPVDKRGVAAFEQRMSSTAASALGFGHDNVNTRYDLLTQLGDPDKSRPILVIQFTDISINENPNDRVEDRRIRNIPGQTGRLTELPWAVYSTPGQPFTADDGRSSYDVNTWLYGPQNFSKAAVVPPPKWDWWQIALLIIGILTAGFIAYYTIKSIIAIATGKAGSNKVWKVTLENLNDPFVAAKSEIYTVCGPGAKVEGLAIHITDQNAPSASMFQIEHSQQGIRIKCLLGKMDKVPPSTSDLLQVGRHEFLFRYQDYTRRINVIVEAVQR